MNKKTHTLSSLAEFLSAEFKGDPDCIITGIGSLANAKSGQITFLQDKSYAKYLSATKASAVIIRPEFFNQQLSGNFLVVNDPYLAYAKISIFFADHPKFSPGIHPTVIVGERCEIAKDVSIGPYCVLGQEVKLESGVQIESGCSIGDGVIVEEGTRLCANVTVYHKVKLGKRGILHSGVVIGSDGFGNANDKGIWHKIHQLGTVIVGNDVEVGANTTIDRGTIDNTIIEDGVKIDNQVQIAHNVQIGKHTAIAGCVGIAGSTKIGSYCMIGGGVGITGHIEIASGVIITGGSNIGKSITKPGVYASSIHAVPHRAWWRAVARLMQLENLIQRLREVEKKIL